MLFQVDEFIDKETEERNGHYAKNMNMLLAFEPLFELPQELVASASAHESQMKANSASPADAGGKGKRRRRNTQDSDL